MNHLRLLARAWLLLALVGAVGWFGCAAPREGQPPEEAREPVYDTPESIRGMPSCRAVAVERGPCYLVLRTSAGKRFYLGSPGMGAEVGRFLEELEEGRTYRLPDAFLRYQRQRQGLGR